MGAGRVKAAKGSARAPVPGYGHIEILDDGTWRFVDGDTGAVLVLPPVSALAPGGRLSPSSGVSVLTSDVTGAGTLYYVEKEHDILPLLTAEGWQNFSFSNLSLPISASSGQIFDVFAHADSGAAALEQSAAWASATTRTDALGLQNGRLVKASDPTRLFLGTCRASGTNVTEVSLAPSAGSASAKIFVWNMYNPIQRGATVTEPNDSWNYTTATWRQMRASALNQIEYVCGLAGAGISALASAFANNASALTVSNGIGVDSTSANSSPFPGVNIPAGMWWKMLATYEGYMQLGYHYLAALEYSQAIGTTTWGGDVGAPGVIGNGISAKVWL